NSGSILSLLKEDILSYEPDLITLYAGFNDTGWPIRIGFLGRVALWLQGHSITYLLLKDNFSQLAFKAEVKVLEKVMPQKLPAEQLTKNSELVADRYQKTFDLLSASLKTAAYQSFLSNNRSRLMRTTTRR